MSTFSVFCHDCGKAFPSEDSPTDHGISRPILEGVVYECPHCGTRDPYFAAEHRLGDMSDFAPDRPAGSGWLARLPSRWPGLRRFVP